MTLQNKKYLGQHWLKNRAILDEIADLAVTPGVELCVEIGPGLGTLTSSLLARFPEVTAIEFDARLAENLPKSFPGKNLHVINKDVLDADFAALTTDSEYVVAGNIPYYITSPIIKKLLLLERPPRKIVLLIQKEVAERLAAGPGDYSLLGLFAQNLADVELGPVVKASEFTPPPKVDSQVVVLSPRETRLVSDEVLDFAKIGFSAPRKKLTANLAAGTGIAKEAWKEILDSKMIDSDCRPGDLDLGDWEEIWKEGARLWPR